MIGAGAGAGGAVILTSTFFSVNALIDETMLAGDVSVGGAISLTNTNSHSAYRACGHAHLRINRSAVHTIAISKLTCQRTLTSHQNHLSAKLFSVSIMASLLPRHG